MKKIVLLLIVAIIMSGCQPVPEKEAVINKNDGALEEKIQETALTENDTDGIRFNCTDTFQNDDGSILYEMRIDQSLPAQQYPTVAVKPHFLNGKEVQQIATAILGDAEFYEQEYQDNPQYTKDELRSRIQMMSKYGTTEQYRELVGAEAEIDVSHELENYQRKIAAYTKHLDSAPEGNFHQPCAWSFRPDTEYFSYGEGIDQLVAARCNIDGHNYALMAKYREADDFQLSGMSIVMGLDNFEKRIVSYELCRRDAPTEEQVENIESKASGILNTLNIGDWQISKVTVQEKEYGASSEYQIVVNAVPVFGGVSALEGMPVPELDQNYGPTYYMTGITFRFSPDGTLMEFGLDSPLDVVEVINENTNIISSKDLMERIKMQLSYEDKFSIYNGFFGDMVEEREEFAGEKIVCQASVISVECGLGRVKVPDNDNLYYYLPVITCIGSVEYYGADSGKLYMGSHEVDKIGMETQPLVWINAVDGSVL